VSDPYEGLVIWLRGRPVSRHWWPLAARWLMAVANILVWGALAYAYLRVIAFLASPH
jgi:hypothetical protein